ncbi:hypothetical protein QJS10_CPB21g01048 [Acorus calamus]|uniref:Aminotransferase-like plant mobile domain-containing protein n=1 Tax=Acorus calamus TaxID=4465 RepID=A0AAV9C7F6_ACOCL|nr:hypothetical protein QJS10_CPB21g01048 [Acorus calamus]
MGATEAGVSIEAEAEEAVFEEDEEEGDDDRMDDPDKAEVDAPGSTLAVRPNRIRALWHGSKMWYASLGQGERSLVDGAGFRAFFLIEPFHVHRLYVEDLAERCDPESCTFILHTGAVMPTLEDVHRITSLPISGEAVIVATLADYKALFQELIGEWEFVERERTLNRSPLGQLSGQYGLGSFMERQKSEVVASFERRRAMIEAREEAMCPQRAQRESRAFFLHFFGRVLISTASDKVSSHSLFLMRDLEGMGHFAWGAAMLAHLFAELSKKVKRAGGKNLGGFAPFLQVFGYEHFTVDRPIPVPFNRALPWAMRWAPRGSLRLHRLAHFREVFRVLTEEEMIWRPYTEEEVPEELSRDVWLIYFNEVVFHAINRVVR